MSVIVKRKLKLPVTGDSRQAKSSSQHLHLVEGDSAANDGAELSQLLLRGPSRPPLKTEVHEAVRARLAADSFGLSGEVRLITGRLLESAHLGQDCSLWERVEMLLGTPGATFVDKNLMPNLQPVMEGIADYLRGLKDNSITFSEVCERVLSFTLIKTHSAYAQARSAHDTWDSVDDEAELQVQRGHRILELFLEKTRWKKNHKLTRDRIESGLKRIQPVVTLNYRR